MNKKLFFLILCGLGLILWAVGFFFGFNYTQRGALMVSIPVALLVLVIMVGMIFLMKKFCNGGENYRVAKNTEKAALCIYIVVSLVTSVYIAHFVSVSMNVKTKVQDQVLAEIDELARIYSDGESGSYVAWVDKECDALKNSLEGQDAGTIAFKVENLREELMNKSGFTNKQTEILGVYDDVIEGWENGFLPKLQGAIESWDWLTVSERISLLEANKEEWKHLPEEYSKTSDYTKNEPYDCDSKVNYSNISAPMVSLSGNDFSISALVLIIVLQIMILLSYISDRPNTGRDPIRYKNNDFVRSYGAKKKSVSPSSNSNKHRNGDNNQNNQDFVINLDDDE